MNHVEPTPEQKAEFEEWAATRPEAVKANCARFKPWCIYRNKVTDQRMSIVGYYEDGTLNTVVHPSLINPFHFGVFGVPPAFENVILIGPFLKWLKRRAERKRLNALPIDIEAGIRATREAVTANMLHSWQNNWATASNALMPSMTTQQITGPEISSRLQELASTPKRKRGKKTEKYYQHY